MTTLKQGCLMLLNACCLNSSVLVSCPRLLCLQVGGTKTQGEEARRGIEDVQTEKGENGYDIGPLGNKGERGNTGKVNQWRDGHDRDTARFMSHSKCRFLTIFYAEQSIIKWWEASKKNKKTWASNWKQKLKTKDVGEVFWPLRWSRQSLHKSHFAVVVCCCYTPQFQTVLLLYHVPSLANTGTPAECLCLPARLLSSPSMSLLLSLPLSLPPIWAL